MKSTQKKAQHCGNAGECDHGNPIEECQTCFAESDRAYDEARENRA